MSEGHTLACPECRSSNLYIGNSNQPSTRDEGSHNHRCKDCGATFNTPIRRKKRSIGGDTHSPHVQSLRNANPDDVGGEL